MIALVASHLVLLVLACAAASSRPNARSPRAVALEFVAAIGRRDLATLKRLMAKDHVFVDSLGARVQGRDAMVAGWRHYFALVPDYAVRVAGCSVDGEVVLLHGEAEGTYAPVGKTTVDGHWRVPAAWRAVVRGGEVVEWQVYADNKRMHELTDGRGSPPTPPAAPPSR